MIGAAAGFVAKQYISKKAVQSSLSLDVTADLKEVEAMVWRINKDVVPRAKVSALNKTAMKIRTLGVRETASTLNVTPQKLVRDRYRLRRARLNRQEALLSVLLRSIPAARLGSTKKKAVGAVQHAQGVTAANRSYPHAWLMEPPTRGGGVHVFYRQGKERYPLAVHHVEIAAAATAINDRLVLSEGRGIFAEICTRELKWRLNRASR